MVSIKILVFIISIIMVVLVFFTFFSKITIDFIIKEELRLDVSPSNPEYFVHKGDNVSATFTLKNINLKNCKSICEMSITDLQKMEKVYIKNKTLKHFEEIELTFNFSQFSKRQGTDIYLFDVVCHNLKENTCFTQERPQYESIFIPITYELSEEEKVLQDTLQREISEFLYQFSTIEASYQTSDIFLSNFSDKHLEIHNIYNHYADGKKQLDELKKQISLLEGFWLEEDYSSMVPLFHDINYSFGYVQNISYMVELQIYSFLEKRKKNQDFLKSFVHNTTLVRDISMFSILINESEETNEYTNNVVDDILAVYTTIQDDYFFEQDILNRLDDIFVKIQNSINASQLESSDHTNEQIIGHVQQKLNTINFSIPFFEEIYYPSLEDVIVEPYFFEIPKQQCCAFGACSVCCDQGCEETLPPVIFLHGHNFNKENSPKRSMNLLKKIQIKMVSDGYINAGELDIHNNNNLGPPGIWGKTGHPITVTSSYYYTNYYGVEGFPLKIQKYGNMQEYANRLADIIAHVQYKTGASKVALVGHSMGGLVIREYVNIYGYDAVDTIITLNTPHLGITPRIEQVCSLIGNQKGCQDMTVGSSFLSDLKKTPLPPFANVYSIRSTGCMMQDGEGDGIVLKKNGYWEGAKNYLITGNCNDVFNTNLHSRVLDPDEYPQMYEKLISLLKSSG